MLEQKQIQEFKEVSRIKFKLSQLNSNRGLLIKAFNMFDQDHDGIISADDLKEFYNTTLGKKMRQKFFL